MGGITAELARGQIGPLLKSLRHLCFRIRSEIGRQRFVGELETIGARHTERGGKSRAAGLDVILGADQRQFGIRNGNLGEAHVEGGFERTLRQPLHLAEGQPAALHHGLRDLQHGVGGQSLIVGLVHLDQDFRPGISGDPVLCGGAEFCRVHQVRGAAKIGDELTDGHAGGHAAVEARSLYGARGERRTVLGSDAGQISGEERVQRRPGLRDHRLRRLGKQVCGTDPGMIAQRNLLGFGAREPSRRLRGCQARDRSEGEQCDAAKSLFPGPSAVLPGQQP